MKPKIYALILTIFLSVIQYTTFAQTTELAAWDFAAGNTTPVLTTGISSAFISVGGSLQRSYDLTNSFLFTNIWATSQSQALNGNGTMAAQYISFTIAPAANYSMDIASISIQGYNSSSTIGRGFLPAYIDPITGNLVTLTSQAKSVNATTPNPTFAIALTNITTPIEFRFYIYNYPVSISDVVGFGEQAGYDLSINGNVHNSATQVIPGTWSLQGNTVAGTQFLGSVNNQDVVIYTNNAEKMRIGANGNVAIGTTTLTQKLNVAGDVGITGDFYQNGTKLDLGSWTQSGFQDLNPSSPTYNQTLGQLSNTPYKQKMVLNAGVVEINAAVSAWQGISVGGRNQYSAGGPDQINNMPAYGIALNQSTGVVQVAGYNGINFVDNTAPTSPALSISNGSVTANGLLNAKKGIKLPDGSVLTSAGVSWNMTNNFLTYTNDINVQGKLKLGTGSLYATGINNVTGTRNEVYGDNGALFINSNAGNTQNTIINSGSGNVGIGTGANSPSEKLEVAGKIKTQSIQITNSAGVGKILSSDVNGNAIWSADSWLIVSYPAARYLLSATRTADQCIARGGSINQSQGAVFCLIPARNDITTFDPIYNVGIGTNLPTAKLDVAGNIKAQSIQIGDGAVLSNLVSSQWTNIFGGITYSGNANVNGNILVSGTSGVSYLGFPDGTKQYTAGNSTTSSRFTVNASGNSSGIIFGASRNADDNTAKINQTTDNALSIWGGGTSTDTYPNYRKVNIYSEGGGKYFGKLTLVPPYATAPATGHSDALLDVDGYIYSKKSIITQVGWADDEFVENAKTPTLEEEETTASKEQHLLGVPTETELKEKGLDLGEMQAIQMRKIEQLYKHLWKMNQRMEELEKENAALKSKLK